MIETLLGLLGLLGLLAAGLGSLGICLARRKTRIVVSVTYIQNKKGIEIQFKNLDRIHFPFLDFRL